MKDVISQKHLELNREQALGKMPKRKLINLERESGKYYLEEATDKGTSSKQYKAGRGIETEETINLCSNDYLGMSFNKDIIRSARNAIKKHGTGSGGSRLVSGNAKYCTDLEDCLAQFLGYQAALLFGSGTLCNSGLISSIATTSDYCIIDKLCHASIIDGVRLSGAKMVRFNHCSVEDLERKIKNVVESQSKCSTENETLKVSRAASSEAKIFVITESIFSMDGDIPPLRETIAVCNKYGALLVVDESHGIGTIGKQGEGVCKSVGIQPFAITASLGKAFASHGGICFCSKQTREIMVNLSRAFIFATALPPSAVAVAGAVLNKLGTKTESKHPTTKLYQNINYFTKNLKSSLTTVVQAISIQSKQNNNLPSIQIAEKCEGSYRKIILTTNPANKTEQPTQLCEVPITKTPIVPIIFTKEETVLEVEQKLKERNIFVRAIRRPSVPEGRPRLRITISNTYRKKQIKAVAKAIAETITEAILAQANISKQVND